MQRQPQAEALVLLASQARLAADRVVLPGGAAAVVVEDDDGDQVVQVTGGRVLPAELVRAVVRTPGFSARDRAIDVVVITDLGWDRLVVDHVLATRLLVARHDDQRAAAGGRHVVVIGPPVDEPLTSPAPSHAATAVASLVARSSRPVGRLTELPLVADPTWADAGGRRPGLLAEADVVVAAWGVVGHDAELALDDALDALRGVRERGGAVLVRSRGGEPDAVGADRQPAARDANAPGDGLLTAPADWLWGAPLH